MSRSRIHLASVVAGAALLVSAAPAPGQSLFASRGLGLAVEPIDARAAGLGGIALGLPGANLSLVNPAGVAGIPVTTLITSYRFDSYRARLDDVDADGSTARFPLLHGAHPIDERWTVSIGYGSLFDQTWAVRHVFETVVAGDTILVADAFESQGGAGRFRAGGAYQLTERLALGAALDVYTGSVQREMRRTFDGQFDPTVERREWSYRGVGYAAGLKWAPTDAVDLGAAVQAGGTIEASPADTLGAAARYALPLSLHLGASARVAPNLLAAAGGEWTGWSRTGGDLNASGPARDVLAVQGGIEYDGMTIRERALPLRLGARLRQLPFGWGDAAEVDERALTGGLGIRLAGGAANLDLSVERGWRGGGGVGIDESYWRTMLSLNVFGR